MREDSTVPKARQVRSCCRGRIVTADEIQITGSPITLFWDSDIAKWIEAACYFLSSPEGRNSCHRQEFEGALDELIGMMGRAQSSDGYLGTYFTVVDRKGRLQNLRDMHEMCKFMPDLPYLLG